MDTVRTICVALVMALSLAVAGCNTTKGVGQDVEEAGKEIQDAADK